MSNKTEKKLPAKKPTKKTAVSKKTSVTDATYSGNMKLSVALSPEQGLNRYLSEVRKYPMLAKDE